MSDKKPKEPQPIDETAFLDRLTDWRLDDLVVEKPPKPEEPDNATRN